MPNHNDKHNKKRQNDEEDSGSGSQGTRIQFTDFVGSGVPKRDDQLPPDEKRRLLSQHRDSHEISVKKQKDRRDHYKALKEGKASYQISQQYGMTGSSIAMDNGYKSHPLSQTVQFGSGTDNQLNPVPTEFNAQTNENDQHELTHEYQLKHQPQYAPGPTFNPKPQPNS